MIKIALKFGLFAGLIITLLMFALMPLWEGSKNFAMGEVVGYITMILAFSMVFFGIYQFREKESGGSISFGKAFYVGLLITVVASTVYVLGWMIYSQFIAPETMDEYFNYAIEQIQNSGMTPEEIDRQIAKMNAYRENYQNPLVQVGITYMEILPVGIIVTLLAALIMKKKPA